VFVLGPRGHHLMFPVFQRLRLLLLIRIPYQTQLVLYPRNRNIHPRTVWLLRPRHRRLSEPNGQLFLLLFLLPRINILDRVCVQPLVLPVFTPPSKVFPSSDTRTAHHGRCRAHGNCFPLFCQLTLRSRRVVETAPSRRCPRSFPV